MGFSQINMRKQHKILLIGLMTIFAIGLYYWGIIMDENIEEEYQIFYDSDLNGIIDIVSVKYHGTSFKLKGNKHEFVFYPKTDSRLNDGKIFKNFANQGDSIQKQPNGDTLFLIKEGKKYKYVFRAKP